MHGCFFVVQRTRFANILSVPAVLLSVQTHEANENCEKCPKCDDSCSQQNGRVKDGISLDHDVADCNRREREWHAI